MTRTIALLAAATILGLTRPAAAQEPPASHPVIIAPQTRSVVIAGPRRPAGVRVSTVETSVSIDDQVAATTLVITLSNPGRAPQESVVMIPVPDGAAVRSFGIDGVGDETTAMLLPRDEARRIYESIVRRSRDPGLLEFVGMGAIRSSVFPVPPGGTQTVRLTYEHLLPAQRSQGSGDRIDYTLPRSESLEGAAPDAVRWSLTVDIRAKRPIMTVYSPSHALTIERLGPRHVRAATIAGQARSTGSFRLSVLLKAHSDQLAASVFAYPDPEAGDRRGGYFMLLAALPPGGDERESIKREVTIVIDRSGSMRGEKIRQAREAALQVLEGLLPGERFNIIDYSDSIASFEEGTVVKDDLTTARARAYLKAINAGGGTNIHDALVEALRQKPAPGMLPVVLFLTDGLPTVGKTRETDIRDAAASANTSQRRVFAFGVGYDVNAPLLTGIARQSRGSSTFVLPDEDVEVKVSEVFRRLSGPLMSAPRLQAIAGPAGAASRAIRDLEPGELPDLFEGDQLTVLGRYTSEAPFTLRLSGSSLGTPTTFEIDFDPASASARHASVPRLWATRRIASLLEHIRLAAADPRSTNTEATLRELVEEIVHLSRKWGILTEYTAFLAVEPGSELARRDEALYAPVPASQTVEKTMRNISSRAEGDRAGKSAVSQELNLSAQRRSAPAPGAPAFWDKDMKKTELHTVQQVRDGALFRRDNRWVESALLDHADEAPDVVVEFATNAYFQLADELASQHRQAVLAQRGDVYLVHNGKRVLVRGGE